MFFSYYIRIRKIRINKSNFVTTKQIFLLQK